MDAELFPDSSDTQVNGRSLPAGIQSDSLSTRRRRSRRP